MQLLIIIAIIWSVSAIDRHMRDRERKREIARINAESKRRAAEAARIREEVRRQKEEAKEWTRKQVALEREQIKQAKELQKHEEWLKKHDEQLEKLEQRLSLAETEIMFNREQRERLFKLLDIAEVERDAAIEGGKEWQKWQRKVISLEGQIHTVQKRIDKAHMDKAFCEKRLSA